MSRFHSLSIFDLDHTLMKFNATALFYSHLVKRGLFPFSSLFTSGMAYIEHRWFYGSLLRLHEKAFYRYLKGRPFALFEDLFKSFLPTLLPKMLYMPVFTRLRLAQSTWGHYTAVFSSSPSFIVAPIGRALGFDLSRGSEYGFDQKGNVSSILSIVDGKKKAEYAASLAKDLHIQRENVIAYSDSILDLDLLQFAKKAIVVRPKGKLKKLAKKFSWEVL